jgi:alpha-1,2-mannosyltransferase
MAEWSPVNVSPPPADAASRASGRRPGTSGSDDRVVDDGGTEDVTAGADLAAARTEPPANWWWFAVGLAGCCAVVTLGAWALGMFDRLIDLRVYRMGGSLLLHGGQLYEAHLAGSGLPFTYPPFAAVMMVPLAIVPWPVAVSVWTWVSVLCLAAIWWVSLPARLRTGRMGVWLLVGLTAGSLILEPVWQTLQFGQINLLLTAMILLDLVAAPQRRWRGALVGVAAGLKLTPLLFVAFLVVTGQWRALRNALLGLVISVGIGFAVVPNQSWDYWTQVVRDAERVGGLAFTANQSVLGFLTRLGGDAAYVRPLWFVISAPLALAGLWMARRMWFRDERLLAVSVCALAALFASPVSWSHHWVWAIPLGVCLVQRTRGAVAVAVGVVWFGVFALGPIWWVPYRDDRELDWTFWQSLPGNAYLILGSLAFVLLSAREQQQQAADRVPDHHQ